MVNRCRFDVSDMNILELGCADLDGLWLDRADIRFTAVQPVVMHHTLGKSITSIELQGFGGSLECFDHNNILLDIAMPVDATNIFEAEFGQRGHDIQQQSLGGFLPDFERTDEAARCLADAPV